MPSTLARFLYLAQNAGQTPGVIVQRMDSLAFWSGSAWGSAPPAYNSAGALAMTQISASVSPFGQAYQLSVDTVATLLISSPTYTGYLAGWIVDKATGVFLADRPVISQCVNGDDNTLPSGGGGGVDGLANTVASYGAGQLGYILGTNLDAKVSTAPPTVAAITAAIEAITAETGVTWLQALSVLLGLAGNVAESTAGNNTSSQLTLPITGAPLRITATETPTGRTVVWHLP